MRTIDGLRSFPKMEGLPQGEILDKVLRSDRIKKVVCFSLGPEGTNIAQASRRWIVGKGIKGKSEVVLCETPEACLNTARQVQETGVLAVFWTCAVYSQESQFFFGNPDVLTFFFQETMRLDEMQLATTEANLPAVEGGYVPQSWKISSHPSPQHLLRGLKIQEIILVNSNAAAAQHCKEGRSDACITTESARAIHGLKTLHLFGCPPMVFFGGITPFGAEVLSSAVGGL